MTIGDCVGNDALNQCFRELSMIGLILIAVGTGGIKPCVAALGGDQFILPEQQSHLIRFFAVTYFTINAGSLLSSFITPELRNDIKCFGEQDCYSVAFLVPAILMILSIGELEFRSIV